MAFKTILAAIILTAVCAAEPVMATPNPSFQDFIETAYGYRNKKAAKPKTPVFRDAPSSAASIKGGTERVFVRILPKSADYKTLLSQLSATGDFVFGGEIAVNSGNSKIVYLFGWARPGGIASIRENPGVAGVFAE